MDPYGADTSRSSNSAFQPRKFTTYERDANGTDEAMARRYNRWHSRFDQPDPYDGSYDMTDPQSFNRYAYTHGDPVNYIDPTGMDDISGHEFCLNGECGDNEGYATSYGGGTSMSNGGSGGGRSYHPPLVGIGNDGTDGDTRAVNGAITMCSMGASIGEMSKVSNGMWRGRNGVMYPMRWGGNGATGGRSVAVGMAEELRFLGRAAGVGGMVLSTVQGVQAYRQGDNEGATKSGIDLVMGVTGNMDYVYIPAGLFVSIIALWTRELLAQRESFRIILGISVILFLVGLMLHFAEADRDSSSGALLAQIGRAH